MNIAQLTFHTLASPAIFIPVALIIFFLLWVFMLYNSLIRLRAHVRESWAGIETELQRRYDLIPNLVETVKAYAQHEKQTLQSLTEARSRALASTGSPDQQAHDENNLISALNNVFAVIENYPDLKANRNFLQLQHELANTEDRIQAARRFYNANVRDLNTKIQVIPTNIIASMFKFKLAQYFEISSPAARAAPSVNL